MKLSEVKVRCPRCMATMVSSTVQNVRCPICRLVFDRMEIVK
jgi:tRNA(Ile2) C34 agmatinyltransferase TiaS